MPVEGLSTTYFLVLKVTDSAGKPAGSNFYWLSTKPDKLDWPKSTWYMTPTSDYADFTSLSTLPKVKLSITSKTEHTISERGSGEVITRVIVQNPSKNIAFFNRLKLTGAQGREILPVLWQDNYFSLLPGETREVTATYHAKMLGDNKAVIVVEGFNSE